MKNSKMGSKKYCMWLTERCEAIALRSLLGSEKRNSIVGQNSETGS